MLTAYTVPKRGLLYFGVTHVTGAMLGSQGGIQEEELGEREVYIYLGGEIYQRGRQQGFECGLEIWGKGMNEEVYSEGRIL